MSLTGGMNWADAKVNSAAKMVKKQRPIFSRFDPT